MRSSIHEIYAIYSHYLFAKCIHKSNHEYWKASKSLKKNKQREVGNSMFNKFTGFIAAAAIAATAVFAVASAQADDLEKIKAAGELKIAMSGQYPPFNFVNEKNEVVGFDASIGAAIAERMQLKPQLITTAWDGIVAGLRAGKFDTVVGSMTITPEREKAVDFVGPYYHAGRAVFLKEDSAVQKLDDLKGKTLGVTLGETHEKWAREQGGWTIRTYKGLPELMLELNADNIPVMVAIKETGQKVRRLDTPDIEGGSVAIGIAIRKNNPELKAAMQKALDEIMADGTYEKISMQWVGSDIR
jgi:polar amino acid transport system substrate-binding protein